MKKKTIITLSIIALFTGIFFFGISRLFWGDESKITKEELEFHKSILRNEVRNYYYAEYGIDLDADSWNLEVDGMTPEDYLEGYALQQSKLDRALFVMANEKGILEYSDYRGFLNALKIENETRKEDIAAGKIVYGLTEYSKEEYYQHVLAYVRNELIKEIEVNDEDVSDYLNKNQEEWQANVTSLNVKEILMDKDGNILNEKEYVFDEKSYPEDIKKCPETRLLAEQMKEGETISYTDETEVVHDVTLVSALVNYDEAYAEYKDRIRKVLANDILDQRIRQLAESFG